MNVQSPVSRIMSSYNLKVLMPEDSMTEAKNLFETQNVHHLPVVDSGKLVGIISKSDFLYYTKQVEKGSGDELIQKTLLNTYRVKEIMTKEITTLQKDDTIMEALVGIVTPYDIIKKVIKEGLINIGYNPEPGFDFEGSGYKVEK